MQQPQRGRPATYHLRDKYLTAMGPVGFLFPAGSLFASKVNLIRAQVLNTTQQSQNGRTRAQYPNLALLSADVNYFVRCRC